MLYVIYWRIESNVVDMRVFKNEEEIKDWLIRQVKLEQTAILGIYGKETTYYDINKDYEKFIERFVK